MSTDRRQELIGKGRINHMRFAVMDAISEVWQFRYLLQGIILRDLKVKYQRSALGFVWTFLNPLLTALILIAVFRIVIRIPLPHYWAFLLSGYFVWNAVQQTLLTGSYIFYQYAQLARNIAFPKEVVLFGAASARLIEFAAEMFLMVIVLVLAHHQSIPASLILLPYILIIQFILVLGITFPIVTLSMFFNDVQHALPAVMTSLFYLSPVFYPATMVPEVMRPFYFLNPFAGLLTIYQSILYDGQIPSFFLLGGTTLAACILFIIGYCIFKRYESIYNELI